MEDRIKKTFDTAPGKRLTLELERCAIEIRTHDKPFVDIELTRMINGDLLEGMGDLKDDLHIITDQSNNDVYMRVEIDRDRLSWWDRVRKQCHLKCVAHVPIEYKLNLKTSGGRIEVDDLTGAVECRTAGGDIKLGWIRGTVIAKSSGGGIEVKGSSGTVELKTGGGGIKIGDVEGDVTASTSGGGIHVDRVMGRTSVHTSGGGISIGEVFNTVEAITSGGSVTACLARQPKDHCRLETSGGGVTAYLADDIAVNIFARTGGGRVRCDIPVDGAVDKQSVKGTINGGGPELIMQTSGGGVHIRRYETKGESDG